MEKQHSHKKRVYSSFGSANPFKWTLTEKLNGNS